MLGAGLPVGVVGPADNLRRAHVEHVAERGQDCLRGRPARYALAHLDALPANQNGIRICPEDLWFRVLLVPGPCARPCL